MSMPHEDKVLEILKGLKGDQPQAIDFLSDFVTSDTPIAVLEGYPGTGKTYLCSALAEIYSREVFLFTAPTNKAAQALQLSVGEDYMVKTTYSALSLRLNTSSEQNELVQDLPENTILKSISVLVVDEGSFIDMLEDMAGDETDWAEESYVDERQLLDYLIEAQELFGFKILFLGDPLQLPPPSSKTGESPVFTQGYPTFKLSQVLRHGGDLLRYVEDIRANLLSGAYALPIPKTDKIKIRKFYTKSMLKRDMPYFLDGSMHFIAFRNNTVDNFNNLIRKEKFGEAPKPIAPEDRVLFTTPLFDLGLVKNIPSPLDDPTSWAKEKNFKIIASIDSMAEVVDVRAELWWEMPVYEVDVRLDTGQNATVLYMPEQTQSKFDALLRELRAYTLTAQDSQAAWRVVNNFKGMYNYIKFSWAITSHRAQGSTFKRVLMDAGDIMRSSPSSYTALRSAYVAASRASEHLEILWR